MEPWDFDEELDTRKSYHAFCIYLNLGFRRSLEDAYALYKGDRGYVPGYFRSWCWKKKWVERVRAWDLEECRERSRAIRASRGW